MRRPAAKRSKRYLTPLTGNDRRMRMLKGLAAAALLLTGALVALGISASAPPITGNYSLDGARRFERFQLYYPGRRVAGLPLLEIDRFLCPKRSCGLESDRFYFSYGDCTPPPPTTNYEESPGCQDPLVVHVSPACLKPPSFLLYPSSWKPMRGGRAKRWHGGSLQLWTGRVFVRIDAAEGRWIPEVVRRLVPLNRVDPQPRDRKLLPAPRLDSPKKPYCKRGKKKPGAR